MPGFCPRICRAAHSCESVDGKDNTEQGSKYGGFVTSCHLSTRVHFIFVAIPPSVGLPTGYLCNE
jgi:hypothetical protein